MPAQHQIHIQSCFAQPAFFKVCRRKAIAFAIALLLFTSHVQAQDDLDYAVQANIIYHFTKYIEWPEQKRGGSFIIGVLGDTPLFEKLKTSMAGKKVGEQTIVVKKISPAAAYACHIVFVCDDESDKLKSLAGSNKTVPVLFVAETPGMAKKGACINFIIVGEKLKLEINKSNIESRNLKIASELLRLGIQVK